MEPQLHDMIAETASHLEINPGNTKKRKKDSREYLEVFGKRKKIETATSDSIVQFPIHECLNVDMASIRNLAKEGSERKNNRSKKKSMNRKANDYDTDQIYIESTHRLLGEHHIQGKDDNLKTVEHELEHKVEGSFVVDESTPSERHGMRNPSSDAEQKKKRKKKRPAKREANDKDGVQSKDKTNIMSSQIVFDEHCQLGKDVEIRRVEHESEQNHENSLVVDENTPFEGQSGMKNPSSDVEGKKKKKRKNRKANDKDDPQSMDQTDIRSMQSVSNGHHVQGEDGRLKRVDHGFEQKEKGSFVDDENIPSERHGGMRNPLSDAEHKQKSRNKRSAKREANDTDGLQGKDQTNISMQTVSDEHHVQGNGNDLESGKHELEQEQERSLVCYEITPSEGQRVLQNLSSDAGGKKKRNKKKNRKDDKVDPQGMDKIDIMPTQNVSNEHHVQGEDDGLKRVEHRLEKKEQGSSVDDENTPSERHSVVRNPSSDAEKKQKKKKRSAKRGANDTDGLQGKDQTNMSAQIVSDEHLVQGNGNGLERVEHELEQEQEQEQEQERERSLVDGENTPSEGQRVIQNPSSDAGGKKKRHKMKNRKANDKDDLQGMDQTDIMPRQSVSNGYSVLGKDDKLKIADKELGQDGKISLIDDENIPSEGQIKTKSPSDTEGMKKKKRRKNQKANDKEGLNQTDTMLTQNVSNGDHVHGKDDKLRRIERELEHDEERSLVGDENTRSKGQSGIKGLSYEAEEKEKRSKRRKDRKGIVKDGLQSMGQIDIISMRSVSNGHHVLGKDDKLKRVECASEKVKGSVFDDEKAPFEGQSGIKTHSSDAVGKKKRNQSRKNQKGIDKDGLTEFQVREEEYIEKSKKSSEDLVNLEAKEKERGLQIMNQTDILLTQKKSDGQHVQGTDDKPKRVEHEFEQEVKGFLVIDENTPSEGVSRIKDPSSDAEGKKKNKRKKGRKATNKDGELKRVENELERPLEASSVYDENTPSERQKGTKNPSSDAEVANHAPLIVVNKVDKLLKDLPSPERTLISFSRRKLLILDLNGLLADILRPPPKECKSDINILGRAVFKRPFYHDFLKFCFERFDVGIWSSRTKKVIDRIVDYLLGDMKQKLLFYWDISLCTETKFKTLENKHKPLVFKELRKIWEINDPSLPWKKGDYDESNTLLLDDSPYKALLNPMHTAIFPPSYNFKNRMSDSSLGPGGDLRVYLEDLSTAENVQKYVEQHPFGERHIDETSPFWAFYSTVLRSQSLISTKTVFTT